MVFLSAVGSTNPQLMSSLSLQCFDQLGPDFYTKEKGAIVELSEHDCDANGCGYESQWGQLLKNLNTDTAVEYLF